MVLKTDSGDIDGDPQEVDNGFSHWLNKNMKNLERVYLKKRKNLNDLLK